MTVSANRGLAVFGAMLMAVVLTVCGPSPEYKYSGSSSPKVRCGDTTKQTTELCDGEDFGELTCQGLGFEGGQLSCKDCQQIDTTGCTTSCNQSCGAQECGLDPVCGLPCGLCPEGECADGFCAGRSDAGPLVDAGANTSVDTGGAGQCNDTGCQPGYYCDLGSGVCLAGCISHDQCGSHEVCNTAIHVCECEQSYHRCDDLCVVDDSPSNCGTRCEPCPAPENATPLCANQACDFACNNGYHRCGDVCLADDSPASCGDRCTPCPAESGYTASCVEGACSVECSSADTHGCDGRCVQNDDPATCGDRCEPCPEDPHGQAVCANTSCALVCNDDALLCGGRCAPCPLDADQVQCAGDTCVATHCLEGHYLCNTGCCPWSAEVVDLPQTFAPEVAVGPDGTAWVGIAHDTRVVLARRDAAGWSVLPELGLSYGRIIGSNPFGLSLDSLGSYHLQYQVRSQDGTDGYGNPTFRWDLRRYDQGGHSFFYDLNRRTCGRYIDGHQSQVGQYRFCHICLNGYHRQEVYVESQRITEPESSAEVICKIASEGNEQPVVGIVDSGVSTLKLFFGPAWEMVTYPLEPGAGQRMDLDMTSDGAVHIVYTVDTELRYLIYRDQQWSETTIGVAGADVWMDYLALVMDSNGRGHVLLSQDNGIHYLQQTADGWSDHLVDPDNLQIGVSAVIDHLGRPHFAYYHRSSETIRYFAPSPL